MTNSSPASIAESGMSSLTNSNAFPGAFTSNLVGGKRISRKQMRKIYRSYKNKYSRRGRSIKKRSKTMSMKSNFFTKMFKKIGSKKNKNKRSRYNKRGGNAGFDPNMVNRALSTASISTFGEGSSCLM